MDYVKPRTRTWEGRKDYIFARIEEIKKEIREKKSVRQKEDDEFSRQIRDGLC